MNPQMWKPTPLRLYTLLGLFRHKELVPFLTPTGRGGPVGTSTGRGVLAAEWCGLHLGYVLDPRRAACACEATRATRRWALALDHPGPKLGPLYTSIRLDM